MPEENLPDTAEFAIPMSAGGRKEKRTPTAHVHTEIAGLSHIGKVRTNNEDYFLAARIGRSFETVSTNLPDAAAHARHEEIGCGLVIADGMGGAAAGEVASRCAVEDLVRLALETPDWIMPLDATLAEAMMRRMAERFRLIDQMLIQRARDDDKLKGMGTTMTVAATLGLDGLICHIGDTRAYRFRGGILQQLTRDMSVAQDLVDTGAIHPADAAINQMRHVLTRSLGSGNNQAQVLHLNMVNRDRLLLCSDGLTEMVPDAQIADILAQSATPKQQCEALIERALQAGGHDNVTVVIADYRIVPPS